MKGEAIVDGQGQLKVSLYNGTSFKLKEITVEVTIHHGRDGKVSLDGRYRMTPDAGGRPFEMADFEADTGRHEVSRRWQARALRGLIVPEGFV